MWDKIKKWFGLLDFNKDGKVTAEDIELAQAVVEKNAKVINDQITDAVTQIKKRAPRKKK